MEKVKIKDIKNHLLEVKIEGETKFINLSEELSINESKIMDQLQNSPSTYDYLCKLKDEACRRRDNLEREKDAVFSRAWLFYKESNSKMTNDMATHKATISQKYQSYLKKYIKADYMANQLISICKAFESRERILQTVSANLRKQL